MPHLPGDAFRLYKLERLRGRRAARMAVCVIYIAVSIFYLGWRLTVFNADAPLFSTVFYAAEVVGFLLSLHMIVIGWNYRLRDPVAAPAGCSVDVLIPTYNEDTEMVRRTVLAAIRIQYPHTTWLLDDGNRPAIKALADELGCHYVAREKNTNAKPGNLNNALKQATGDFLLILDADFVAQPNILDCLLGYFSDADVAFVQCPQDYYNITAYQYRRESKGRFLWHDEEPFYAVLQPGRDYWNAASSCGTSVVYRRSAINAIGGFAEETVTEDMHTAVRLQRKGYKSVYYPEPLAYGAAPNDFVEYQKTRHRWGRGNIQGLRCERVPFSSGLTFMQRICYLQLGTMYLEGWQRLVLYFAPPFSLITGIYPVGDTSFFFWLFVPYILLGYLAFEEMLRGYARFFLNEQLCMARFPIYIHASFALFRDYGLWRVSSKKVAGVLPIYVLLPQLAVLSANLIGIGFGMRALIDASHSDVPRWITAIVCTFAALYSAIAVQVILEGIKRARYQRQDFRFDLPLPITIDGNNGTPLAGLVSSISTHGMTFKIAGPIDAWKAANELSGTVYLPEGPIAFRGTIESPDEIERLEGVLPGKNEFGIRFQWPNSHDRDCLDLALYSCGWHRKFVHPDLYLVTPLEWITNKLFARSPAEPLEQWTYILYRDATDTTASWRLAVRNRPQDRAQPATLIAFKPLAAGDRLTILDASDGRIAMSEIVVTQPSTPASIFVSDAAPVFQLVYDNVRDGAPPPDPSRAEALFAAGAIP